MNSSPDLLGLALTMAAIVFAFWFYFYLPWTMAEERGRSPLFYTIVGLAVSPLLVIVILLVIGPTSEKTS